MNRLLLLAFLLLSCAAPARAQAPTGVAALDQLVLALNAKSVAGLAPYLTPDTRVGAVPAAYTAQVLAQVFPKFGPVESLRVARQAAEGPNTRYWCAIVRQGAEKEYDFLLSPAGQFIELNLAQASVKKIDTRFSPADLTTPASLDVPLRLVNGLVLVEAEVNGRRGTFILDSGAPALMLNKREFAAPTAGTTLTPNGPQGANGSIEGVSFCVVNRFDWAGLSFAGKEVPTLDLAAIEQQLGGPKLLGLIGYNLLSQYALTVDYRAAQVRLRKPGAGPAAGPPAPAPLLAVPFALRGHLPVVEVTAGGRPYRLALDCGAQANVLAEEYAPAFAAGLRRPTTDTLRGADNRPRAVRTGQIPELKLGPLAFRNQQTAFSDLAHLNKKPGEPAIQGIAGYPFLGQYRTTIDYVNQRVEFRKW